MEAPEVEKLVGELEVAVDRLRSLYEQYFMGFEKIEPTVPRKDVDRRIHVMRKEQIRNTAMRFRFQMVLQRYNTYQTHWQRICREIENGTYKRHLAKAQRRFGEGVGRASVPAPPAQAASAAALLAPRPALAPDLAAELAELDREFAPMGSDIRPTPVVEAPAPAARKGGPVWRKAEPAAPRPAPHSPPPPTDERPPARHISRPPPPIPRAQAASAAAPAATRPGAPPPPRAAAPGPPALPRHPHELPDDRVRQIYAQYVDTKRQLRESTAAITYEAVAKSLRDSSAKLREKHGKAVDFEVAVKDGKAILKPVIK